MIREQRIGNNLKTLFKTANSEPRIESGSPLYKVEMLRSLQRRLISCCRSNKVLFWQSRKSLGLSVNACPCIRIAQCDVYQD